MTCILVGSLQNETTIEEIENKLSGDGFLAVTAMPSGPGGPVLRIFAEFETS
jgi:hypothetical protein